MERLLAKFPRLLEQDLWRPSFAKNSSSVLIGFPPTLLVYPSLRTIRELYYFISEEDYSYFFNKSKEALNEKLLDLDYYTLRASAVLTFGDVE